MSIKVNYLLQDLESGQCAQGSANVIAKLIGSTAAYVRSLPESSCPYKGRYLVSKISDELVEKKGNDSLEMLRPQWDEVHQLFVEIQAGIRVITKINGKRYAVKRRK